MGIYNSNFDFNKYRAFYAVAETKSFSKAANLLFVTQPSISRSVKELEEQLNTRLFIRENKNVKLTESGEKLLEYVQKAFNNILLAERVLKENEKNLSGEVRIGIYSHLSKIILPSIIQGFSSKYPEVKFEVLSTSTSEAKQKLKYKELDFIILQYPIFTKDDTYNEEIIYEMDNCFFSSKKYFDLYTSNEKKIIEYPLILPFRGYEDINKLEDIFKKENMFLKPNLRIYSISLAKELVKKDLGIAWGPKKMIEEELKNKIFYEIPINITNPKTKFSIAYDERYLNKTAIEFLKFIKENIK